MGMSNLIERQDAIDAIRSAPFSFTIKSDIDFANYREEIQEIFNNILDAQEKALNELPSAQPQSTMGQVNETAQSTNDCISRLAAIAEFSCCELTPDGGIDANYAIDFLLNMPSAQPIDMQEAYYRGKIDGIKECTARLKKVNEEFKNEGSDQQAGGD